MTQNGGNFKSDQNLDFQKFVVSKHYQLTLSHRDIHVLESINELTSPHGQRQTVCFWLVKGVHELRHEVVCSSVSDLNKHIQLLGLY